MKRIVIVGATSGIGLEVARQCIARGWRVGAAGRRAEALQELKASTPQQVVVETLDVTHDDAPERLLRLIDALGGMDIYLHCAGIGYQNAELQPQIEIDTLRTNGEGFVRMTTAAFNYFRGRGGTSGECSERSGHGGPVGTHGGNMAAISSIAGTRGMGAAPAYSATKRMQNTYLDALAQLSHMERLNIRITDIRPGFVDTPLLRSANGSDRTAYPMLMRPDCVAAHIVRALERRRRSVVIDLRYAVLVLFWRMIPRWLWERIKIK